jgi:hypothetical protein
MLASGDNNAAACAPVRHDARPSLDERLVVPETNTEVIDGIAMETAGASPTQAMLHVAIACLFYACLAPGYAAAIDMLTRVDEDNDLAPDVSIFPEAPDAVTGERALEEIAFEVLGTETLAHVTRKAQLFALRGVRRVFHVRASDHAVFEWSRTNDTWQQLARTAAITDECFIIPIPIQAFADKLLADSVVAQALLKAHNPVFVDAINAGVVDDFAEGLREGRAERLREERVERLRSLERIIARKLGRALTTAEHNALLQQLDTRGADCVGDAVFDYDGTALAAWLAGSETP